MTQRMQMDAVVPTGFRQVFGLEQYVRGKLDTELLELIKLRASMVNGCAFCVDMHSTDALQQGEDVRRLVAVAAWKESPFFSYRERLVFELTDEVTHIGDGGVSDELWERAMQELGEELLADVILAIATINVWNRIAVSTHASPPPLTNGSAAA